jgi:hypothetical protein
LELYLDLCEAFYLSYALGDIFSHGDVPVLEWYGNLT